jgi:hypothetical protein
MITIHQKINAKGNALVYYTHYRKHGLLSLFGSTPPLASLIKANYPNLERFTPSRLV